jgi:hypothetical protein
MRPAAEPPDPDYDPWDEFRDTAKDNDG